MTTLAETKIITRVLTDDEIRSKAPAIFANEASPARSDRYSFVSTTEVMGVMRANGWQVMSARQQQATRNTVEQLPYKKHMVRFRNPDAITDNQNIPELVLVNSHDGTTQFQFYIGIFRLACTNGLIVAKSKLSAINIRHTGINGDDVKRLLGDTADRSRQIIGQIDSMKAIELNNDSALDLAREAVSIKWGDTQLIDPRDLLKTRRSADASPDLWTRYNVIQENIIKGGVVYENEQRQVRHTRKVTNILEDVRVNTSLWEAVEKRIQGVN